METRRGIRSPGAGLTGNYELTDVGTVNQTQVHRKSSSSLTEPSISPAPILFSVGAGVHAMAHIQIRGQLFFKRFVYIFIIYIYIFVCVRICAHGCLQSQEEDVRTFGTRVHRCFELSNVLSIAGLEDREECTPNH